MGGPRWIPWHTLKERPHLILRWARLHPGRGRIEDVGGGRRVITLDPRLEQRPRAAVLGHELVHDELDYVWPPNAPLALVEKGEEHVHRVTTRRFIPPGELGEFIRSRVGSDLPVTVQDVAEEFACDVGVARDALYLYSISEG